MDYDRRLRGTEGLYILVKTGIFKVSLFHSQIDLHSHIVREDQLNRTRHGTFTEYFIFSLDTVTLRGHVMLMDGSIRDHRNLYQQGENHATQLF